MSITTVHDPHALLLMIRSCGVRVRFSRHRGMGFCMYHLYVPCTCSIHDSGNIPRSLVWEYDISALDHMI